MVQQPVTKSTTDRSIGHMPETYIVPDHTIRPKINIRQVPFYPDTLIKPPPRLPDIKTQVNLDINRDFEEILHIKKV